MSEVSNEDVNKIAHLARISIAEADIGTYSEQLSTILNLVEQLDAVKTDVAPLAHPLEAKQRLAADTVSEPNQRELFLSLAPAAEAGLYLVPKVVE